MTADTLILSAGMHAVSTEGDEAEIQQSAIHAGDMIAGGAGDDEATAKAALVNICSAYGYKTVPDIPEFMRLALEEYRKQIKVIKEATGN